MGQPPTAARPPQATAPPTARQRRRRVSGDVCVAGVGRGGAPVAAPRGQEGRRCSGFAQCSTNESCQCSAVSLNRQRPAQVCSLPGPLLARRRPADRGAQAAGGPAAAAGQPGGAACGAPALPGSVVWADAGEGRRGSCSGCGCTGGLLWLHLWRFWCRLPPAFAILLILLCWRTLFLHTPLPTHPF